MIYPQSTILAMRHVRYFILLILSFDATMNGCCRKLNSGTLGVVLKTNAADRMRMKQLGAGADETSYRAVWDYNRDGAPVAIEIVESGIHTMGSSFSTSERSADGKVLRTGTILSAYEPEQPYALVEMRTSSSLLPPDCRNRWILGVAFESNELLFSSDRPTRIVSELFVGKGEFNQVVVEPIQWSDWPAQYALAPGRLSNSNAQVEYRPAESAMRDAIDYGN